MIRSSPSMKPMLIRRLLARSICIFGVIGLGACADGKGDLFGQLFGPPPVETAPADRKPARATPFPKTPPRTPPPNPPPNPPPPRPRRPAPPHARQPPPRVRTP